MNENNIFALADEAYTTARTALAEGDQLTALQALLKGLELTGKALDMVKG